VLLYGTVYWVAPYVLRKLYSLYLLYLLYHAVLYPLLPPAQIEKLHEDVTKRGLGLVVFGDWYHVETMLGMRFSTTTRAAGGRPSRGRQRARAQRPAGPLWNCVRGLHPLGPIHRGG